MKKLILILCMIAMGINCFSQDTLKVVRLYSAEGYWQELNHPLYIQFKSKQLQQQNLSDNEKDWMKDYEDFLNKYFEKLSDAEKEIYFANKSLWISSLGYSDELFDLQEENRDINLLLKHIGFSGISGITYGLMLNEIFEAEYPASVGWPMIISGGSMLYPVWSKSFNDINNQSLWLRTHGKIMGGIYGWTLGNLIYGDDIEDTYIDYPQFEVVEGKRDQALSMALISSIGSGWLGFKLGKEKHWSEGQVSLYQYYGYMFPAFTSTLLIANGNQHRRSYAANIALSVPLGYLLGHQAHKLGNYSRGDVGSFVGLSAIGSGVGLSIIAPRDFESESDILFLTGSVLAFNALGHYLQKDFHLSRAEGRRVNYAIAGGGLIGLGVAILSEPESEAPYFLVPAISGLIGYGIMANYYRKNQSNTITNKNAFLNNVDFRLYPESIVLNKFTNSNYILPQFGLSLRL